MAAYPNSTTDRAAQIRAALKAKGWSSRDISVKAEYYSMGSSLHIRIKNPAVPLAPVEAIANAHESIDRDQFGDILSGGNRFVHVGYTSEALDVLASRYAADVTAAKVELDGYGPATTSLVPIAATGYLLGRGYTGYGYGLWNANGHQQDANEAVHLASLLAIRLQERTPRA